MKKAFILGFLRPEIFYAISALIVAITSWMVRFFHLLSPTIMNSKIYAIVEMSFFMGFWIFLIIAYYRYQKMQNLRKLKAAMEKLSNS